MGDNEKIQDINDTIQTTFQQKGHGPQQVVIVKDSNLRGQSGSGNQVRSEQSKNSSVRDNQDPNLTGQQPSVDGNQNKSGQSGDGNQVSNIKPGSGSDVSTDANAGTNIINNGGGQNRGGQGGDKNSGGGNAIAGYWNFLRRNTASKSDKRGTSQNTDTDKGGKQKQNQNKKTKMRQKLENFIQNNNKLLYQKFFVVILFSVSFTILILSFTIKGKEDKEEKVDLAVGYIVLSMLSMILTIILIVNLMKCHNLTTPGGLLIAAVFLTLINFGFLCGIVHKNNNNEDSFGIEVTLIVFSLVQMAIYIGAMATLFNQTKTKN